MGSVQPSIYHAVLSLVATGFFFFNDTATTEIYTLSLHDALPISALSCVMMRERETRIDSNWALRPRSSAVELPLTARASRSEEHTSELQSPCNLVCRLLLEKKNR